jgi:hypothetical protein
MKIKFNIKLLSHFQNQSSNKISTSSRSKEEITNNNIQKSEYDTYSNTENIFEYNFESIDFLQNLSIASLKYTFSKSKKLNPDSLILYKLNKEKLYEEIPDYISLSNIIKNGIDYIYELYYKIYDKIIKITINFYQMNIEKIYLKLSSSCSIQMLKMIINEKLNNTIDVESQKIFGLYIININTKEKKIMNQSKEIHNKTIIKNIINSYFENKNSEFMIYFLLSRNLNNKLQMGLNFKFNYLKNISKIKFNENAPKYCECSDGINLFAYCRNKECSINNTLFIHILGYGIFDIMKEIIKVYCPICNKKSEVKNIGLINSKWFYKGKLNCPKQNCFEGDGITIDDQLYILKESKISSLLLKLIIEVKPHIMKKNNSDSNLINDLEDICLCENNKEKIQIEDINILNKIKNNVKYYETESEVKSMNVEIDKGEKIICHSCKISDDNTCYIF